MSLGISFLTLGMRITIIPLPRQPSRVGRTTQDSTFVNLCGLCK